MAYVPGCRHDLFISYASENNRKGWIEQFVNALGRELGDLLGRQFVPKDSVYLDKRELEVAQSSPVRLTAAARDSAILVPILSPGYLRLVRSRITRVLTADECRRYLNTERWPPLPDVR